jgi:hypothetical protein
MVIIQNNLFLQILQYRILHQYLNHNQITNKGTLSRISILNERH